MRHARSRYYQHISFQLLFKDDEILRLRSQLDRLQKQQSGTSQILEKLDCTLTELDRSFEKLKNMRNDNKRLANQLSKVLQEKSDSDTKSEFLSRALEELKNVRVSELFDLEKQKRQLYVRKSEKISVLSKHEDND